MSNTSNPAPAILRKTIIYTSLVAVVIAVVGGLAGYAVAGMDGLLSALVGTALAVIFAIITAVSIMIAIKQPVTTFFGIVLGSWLLKIIVFIALLALITSLDFVQPMVLFLSMVAAIVGTLAVDVVVVMTARQSYVDDSVLPDADAGNSDRPSIS
ncbi:hypothetical protein FVA74_09345 [Salinibacterium sp. dk2585]|uniref:hypothetical protein n=1 Tax=unclassified Salinibacterium TaxID=2632331 RepID=UPI0011C24411|nr:MULTISPECIES: hypothetical protein [unclassified Salinibacterium]QEE61754.1 hypothetical protein FVA74_09345 [Salinibacterium sp. dk2585]TXK54691.1 hypothetical protein FVP63_06615 [Salinibacterium sp. dk5596]